MPEPLQWVASSSQHRDGSRSIGFSRGHRSNYTGQCQSAISDAGLVGRGRSTAQIHFIEGDRKPPHWSPLTNAHTQHRPTATRHGLSRGGLGCHPAAWHRQVRCQPEGALRNINFICARFKRADLTGAGSGVQRTTWKTCSFWPRSRTPPSSRWAPPRAAYCHCSSPTPG